MFGVRKLESLGYSVLLLDDELCCFDTIYTVTDRRMDRQTGTAPQHIPVGLLFDETVTRQGAMERRLLNDLFTTRDYNKLERPVFNETEALTVEFGLTIQQIIDVVSI